MDGIHVQKRLLYRTFRMSRFTQSPVDYSMEMAILHLPALQQTLWAAGSEACFPKLDTRGFRERQS